MKYLALFFYAFYFIAFADIKSNQGQINFDVQSDQQAEMILNTRGLGVGVTPSANLEVLGNVIISEQLYAGGPVGASNINLNGSVGYGYQSVTSDVTLSNRAIILADTSSDNINITLPAASVVTGRVYEIKRMVDNVNFIHVLSSDNIDGDNNFYDLIEYQSIKLISNGTQWFNLTPTSTGLSTVASANLMAWYKFNYATGATTYDSSGQSRHGAIVDNATVSETDQSLSLDGNIDEVNVTGYKGVTGTDPRSVSLWMKKNGGTADQTMVSWGEDASSQKFIFRTQDGNGSANTIRLEVNGGYVVGSTDVLDNAWHHVALTWENDGSPNVTDTILYLDGEVESTSATSSQSINTASFQDLKIGNGHSGREFNGSLDDVRIYSKALSAAEIKAIYQRGR